MRVELRPRSGPSHPHTSTPYLLTICCAVATFSVATVPVRAADNTLLLNAVTAEGPSARAVSTQKVVVGQPAGVGLAATGQPLSTGLYLVNTTNQNVDFEL